LLGILNLKRILLVIYSHFSNFERSFRLIFSLRDFIATNSKQSFFKNTERQKSIFRIYWENIRWITKFGEINSAYFMYGFDDILLSFNDQFQYLDALSYNKLIYSKNKLNSLVSHAPVINDKYLFTVFVEGFNKSYKQNIKTPKFLGFCNKQGLVDNHHGIVKKWEEIDNIEGFCKSTFGFGGREAFLLNISSGILKIDNKVVDYSDLKNMFNEGTVWILQERIQQHPILNMLYDKSVNSIRLITYRMGNEFKVFVALLKIGACGCIVDNWGKGGLLVDIDIASGRIGEYGIMRGWRRLDRHPDTGVKFKDITIPHFLELKEQALLLHRSLFNLKAVGWDVAVGKDGVVFVEGNARWGIGMLQIVKGGLRKDIHEILKDPSGF
jgi:hypothetical protein